MTFRKTQAGKTSRTSTSNKYVPKKNTTTAREKNYGLICELAGPGRPSAHVGQRQRRQAQADARSICREDREACGGVLR
jgi:hypothetical protein